MKRDEMSSFLRKDLHTATPDDRKNRENGGILRLSLSTYSRMAELSSASDLRGIQAADSLV
jgi:hypothetical protein